MARPGFILLGSARQEPSRAHFARMVAAASSRQPMPHQDPDDRTPRSPRHIMDTLETTFLALVALVLAPLMPLLQRLVLLVLSLGPVPQHIGIIMDGNRRYAKTFPSGPLPVSQGHLSGFNALRSVLEACLKLEDMSTITVYAFAINNFARDEAEVDALMDLAKRNLVQLAGHGEVLARHSARLRMVGRREMLPKDVRLALEKVERMTAGNTGATLNVCIAYAASDEIALAIERSIESQCRQWRTDLHEKETIDVADLDKHMMMAHSPPVDILIRTSGVHRLSDFLLWQSNKDAQLQFTNRYWPLFGLRELVPIILDYQRMVLRRRLEAWTKQH